MTDEASEKLLGDFEKIRRSLPNIAGVKGMPAEREYSILYDKLAMRGIGNRRRLRAKYRG